MHGAHMIYTVCKYGTAPLMSIYAAQKCVLRVNAFQLFCIIIAKAFIGCMYNTYIAQNCIYLVISLAKAAE